MPFDIPRVLLEDTFAQLRQCGGGARECQALWLSPWSSPSLITAIVHPRHSASPVGFQLDDEWLGAFWRALSEERNGVRVQIHTHPGTAYHSPTDDAFPIISTPGFLSLVIPRFAQGATGFDEAFLAQIDESGEWREIRIDDYLRIV